MTEFEAGADAQKTPQIDFYDLSGSDDLFPLPGKKTVSDVCADGKCELPKPKVTDKLITTEIPAAAATANSFYGVESEAVTRYRGGQGSVKAGGEQVAQLTPQPNPDVRVPIKAPRPGGTTDVLPPPVNPKPTDKIAVDDKPKVSVPGQEVFEGQDVAKALQYAKENNLPVFFRMSAEWCGPCRGMKPMWKDAQSALNGKAVFIHVDADRVSGANGAPLSPRKP